MQKEIQILFITPMVQAILDGRKTMTRRVVKTPRSKEAIGFMIASNMDGSGKYPIAIDHNERHLFKMECPYGLPGDILYVRESWAVDYTKCKDGEYRYICRYKADYPNETPKILKWKPSIHMYKTRSRIWLEVVSVRVERLQEISESDAILEGTTWTDNGPVEWAIGKTFEEVNPIAGWKRGWSHAGETRPDKCLSTARSSFGNLWEQINSAESWTANPWVWVVEFKVLSTAGRSVIEGNNQGKNPEMCDATDAK